MMMNTKRCLSILCCIVILMPDISYAKSQDETSQDLTTLYRAARKVISDNQAHINKVDIADKGLSGKAVSAMALDNYTNATGNKLSLTSLSFAEQAMIAAVKEVMDENQDLINEKDVGFKGFLPAIFARQYRKRSMFS